MPGPDVPGGELVDLGQVGRGDHVTSAVDLVLAALHQVLLAFHVVVVALHIVPGSDHVIPGALHGVLVPVDSVLHTVHAVFGSDRNIVKPGDIIGDALDSIAGSFHCVELAPGSVILAQQGVLYSLGVVVLTD